MFRAALLALLTAFPVLGRASHMSGGEIYWECIGQNQYRITMMIYRDCFGIDVDPFYNLVVESPCGDAGLLVFMEDMEELSPLCGSQQGNSTCQGGALPGIQRYTYTGTITLAPCDSWTISYTNIYRNAAIVNLVNPGQQRTYIKAVINTLASPCNDSPRFTNIAIPYVCLGYPISYSFGAFDAEGDSLSYTLISAMGLFGAPLAYVPPHSGAQPIPGLTLDPVTGQVELTLNIMGNWVVVVRVDQWENGVWTGSIMRDMQFVAYPCDNAPPDPTTGLVENLGGSATQTGPRAIELCATGSFCFDMVISDPNTGNVLSAFSNVQQSLPGATFSYSGVNPITATVCWPGQEGLSGIFPFIVTVDDGACPMPGFQTYVYAVNVLAAPEVMLVTVDESCLGMGDGSITAVVEGGQGPYDYSWSNGSSEASIVGGLGSHSVQVSDANGCASTVVEAAIGTQAMPHVAVAGEDLEACVGSAVQLNGTIENAPAGQWSGGQGTFQGAWPQVSYIPSQADAQQGDTYLVLTTIGDTGCPPVSDSLWLSLPQYLADVSVTGSDVLCHGTSDGSAQVSPADPGFTFLWNDPLVQTTAQANGLGAGTWTVVVSDAIGCDTTLSVQIDSPSALLIESTSVVPVGCLGDTDGSAAVVVSGGTAPYSILWSNGADGSSMQGPAGTYEVTVTDANGCGPLQAEAIIEALGVIAIAHAGPDQIVCPGTVAVELQGQVEQATTGIWSGGSGTFNGTGLDVTYEPGMGDILAGGVDLLLTTVSDGTCPPATDTVHIAISNSFMQASLEATMITCHGAQNGALTFTPATVGLTYQWDDPEAQTGATATGLPPGAWSVTVTDTLGCDSTLTATIAEPTPLIIQSLSTTPITCSGGSDGTAEVIAMGGTGTLLFTWSDGQQGMNATSLPAGMIAVLVSDANGCTITGDADIAAPPAITLEAIVPDTLCVNTPVQLTAEAAGGNGGHVITWAGLGNGSSIETTFGTSQTVSVSVVDELGCAGPTLTFPVTVLDLPSATLLTSGDTTVCPGGTATISASLSGYPGAYSLQWSITGLNGPGPHTVMVEEDMLIEVIATDVCGNSLIAPIQLMIDTPPVIALPPVIAEGCAPFTCTLPDLGLPAGTQYLWHLGSGQTSNLPAPMVTYQAGTWPVSLSVSTALGCPAPATTTGMVVVHQPPMAGFTASPWQTDLSNPTVHFSDGSTGAIAQWAWDFGDGASSFAQHPVHTYLTSGSMAVWLWVLDIHGCADSVMHAVTIDVVHDVQIPNVFTPDPNGSGGGAYDPYDLSNDVFYPFAQDVKDFRMRIFNRWGELVFESDDMQRGWDGWYRGQLSPQDVYMVRSWFRFTDGKELARTTDLTLLR